MDLMFWLLMEITVSASTPSGNNRNRPEDIMFRLFMESKDSVSTTSNINGHRLPIDRIA